MRLHALRRRRQQPQADNNNPPAWLFGPNRLPSYSERQQRVQSYLRANGMVAIPLHSLPPLPGIPTHAQTMQEREDAIKAVVNRMNLPHGFVSQSLTPNNTRAPSEEPPNRSAQHSASQQRLLQAIEEEEESSNSSDLSNPAPPPPPQGNIRVSSSSSDFEVDLNVPPPRCKRFLLQLRLL